MSQNQYFRAGAGAVIYDQDKNIYTFKRVGDLDIWQFPQGGMDTGETSEETLWRELEEETGLTKDTVSKVTSYPNWLYYAYPKEMCSSLFDPNCLGQIHRWYYLLLKPGVNIDLTTVSHPEFSTYKKTTFPEFIKANDSLKGDVFRKLSDHFNTI